MRKTRLPPPPSRSGRGQKRKRIRSADGSTGESSRRKKKTANVATESTTVPCAKKGESKSEVGEPSRPPICSQTLELGPIATHFSGQPRVAATHSVGKPARKSGRKNATKSTVPKTRQVATKKRRRPADDASSSRSSPSRSNRSNHQPTETTATQFSAETQNIRQPGSTSKPGRIFIEPWCFGGPTESCEFCGAAEWIEESVGKCTKNSQPKFSICCQKGKVKLPLLQDPPGYLKGLLNTNGGPRSKKFRKQILHKKQKLQSDQNKTNLKRQKQTPRGLARLEND